MTEGDTNSRAGRAEVKHEDIPVKSAGRGFGKAQLRGKDGHGDLKQGLAGAYPPGPVHL